VLNSPLSRNRSERYCMWTLRAPLGCRRGSAAIYRGQVGVVIDDRRRGNKLESSRHPSIVSVGEFAVHSVSVSVLAEEIGAEPPESMGPCFQILHENP